MLDCIPIHAYIDTTVETACPTLIAMGFVYHTLAFCFGLANILPTSTDGTLEKTSVTITSENSVMFSGGVICADFARYVIKDATGGLRLFIRRACRRSNATA